jgi:hypothetical protein
MRRFFAPLFLKRPLVTRKSLLAALAQMDKIDKLALTLNSPYKSKEHPQLKHPADLDNPSHWQPLLNPINDPKDIKQKAYLLQQVHPNFEPDIKQQYEAIAHIHPYQLVVQLLQVHLVHRNHQRSFHQGMQTAQDQPPKGPGGDQGNLLYGTGE